MSGRPSPDLGPGVPPRNTRTIFVRLPRAQRMFLQFHLEATDGLAYLEDTGVPDLGRLEVSPDQESALRAYLEDAAGELGLEILPGAPRAG